MHLLDVLTVLLLLPGGKNTTRTVPPPMLHMTKLMEQLQLHIFAQMAPSLLAYYLPVGCPGQPGPRATNNKLGTRV